VNPYTQFNLDAARAKIKQAERINGGPIPTLTLSMGDTDTGTRQLAQDFINDMAKIGIKINAEYFTWARFQERVDSGQAQLFNLGWIADYPDEQDFLQLFYSKNANGGINSSGYHNAEFDALYEKAIQMERSPKQAAMYLKMEHMVMEDCPWLLTFYPEAYTLHYDWLTNVIDMDYGYGGRQHLSLDVALRQKRLGGH
jgi:ABC-type transport system substrate-binding protein